VPDPETHRHAADTLAQADVLIFGRVLYQMMEGAFRPPQPERPDWMMPFTRTINAAKKYVVTSTLDSVDWNAEILRPDNLETAVRELKHQPGNGLYVGGVTLPQALAELGLIDEYEFVVQPRVVGHGRTFFSGLSKPLELTLVDRLEFASGSVAMKYVPKDGVNS
jgi:dihydrofolate reductase